jgi:hypothetical protein
MKSSVNQLMTFIVFGLTSDCKSWREEAKEPGENSTLTQSVPSVIHQNFKSLTKSRLIRWARNLAGMVAVRNAYKILIGNIDGRKPHGGLRHTWEGNFEVYVE